MRAVPAALAAHLKGQATTLAHCWRLTRQDGVVLGFTDHDAAIVFEGTRFEAATGLSASEADSALGLGVGTQEVEGALSSLSIEERDIAAGRFDGARVESFLVNWQAVEQRVLLDVAELGEVKRGGPAFTAELRGIAARLDRRRGRLYRRRCDAVLGDARCRVDVTLPVHVAAAVVVEVGGGFVIVSGVAGRDLGLFENGHAVWRTGASAGLSADIAGLQRAGGETVRLWLADADPDEVAAGDALTLHAGCDKSYATCKGRFANGLNFRGFPHLPGNDAAMGFAKKDGLHDGSPVVP